MISEKRGERDGGLSAMALASDNEMICGGTYLHLIDTNDCGGTYLHLIKK